MKKIQLLLVLMAIIIIIITIASTGCKASHKEQSTDSIQADSTQIDSLSSTSDTLAIDSIIYNVKRDSTIESKIIVAYPKGNNSLSETVKTFLNQQLAATYLPIINSENHVNAQYPIYKGSVTDGKQMVNHYGKGALQYLASEQKAQLSDRGEEDGDFIPCLSQEVEINKCNETDRYVTYRISTSTFLGGAHTSFTFYCINISKQTFKPVEKTINASAVRKLQPILRKGIVQYLKDCGEEDATTSNLNSYLILNETENELIPLPVHAPYLQGNKLCFVYQQYEIAPYAMGLISFDVPYKDIKPYLTSEAKELIGE